MTNYRLISEFQTVQEEVEDLHDNSDQQLQYSTDFENSYYSVLSLAKFLLIDCNPPTSTTFQTNVTPNSDADSLNVKLPQIHLPKFNGHYLNCLEF